MPCPKKFKIIDVSPFQGSRRTIHLLYRGLHPCLGDDAPSGLGCAQHVGICIPPKKLTTSN